MISNGTPAQKRTEPCRLPDFLLEKQQMPGKLPAGRTRFLTRTLRHFSGVFANEFYAERFAARPFFLHPRVALVLIVVLLALGISVSFFSSLTVLIALALVPLSYACLSGLEIRAFVRRAWAYLPPVVFLFSLPGASNLFLSGRPLFILIPPGALSLPHGLYFTAAGLETAFRLALRCGISLSFAFLLLLTTRWSRITAALAALRLPAVLLSVLDMAYRYLFILTERITERMEARFLRTVGRRKAADDRRFMGRSASALFLRSRALGENVYEAMVCRGFSGQAAHLRLFHTDMGDWLFVLNSLIIFLFLIVGEHVF